MKNRQMEKKSFKRKISGMLVFFLICTALTGCTEGNHTPESNLNKEQESPVNPETVVGQKTPTDSENQTSTVKVLAVPEYPVKQYKTEEEEWEDRKNFWVRDEFADALKDFSYETACELLMGETENSFYSPASLYFALAAATSGAKGNTQQQLLDLLGYETEKQLAEDCCHGFQCLYQDKELYKLQIASSLWANQGLTINRDYLDHVRDTYFMEAYQGDFSTADMSHAMANWVSEHTKGLIQPSIVLDANQVLSLINTIYYYDEWQDQFDKNLTKEGIFSCGNGEEVTCDFMNRTMGSHGFYRGENFTVSYLNTKNGHVRILLPDKGVDIREFLESPKTLKDALEGSTVIGEVVWKIPKFSYSSSYKLTDMLKKLGVTDAFSSEQADFTEMTQEPAWIDKVSQDTHIAIDENGIEAVAFTVIDWAGAAIPQGRADMVLDRPFLYMIESSDCVLFVGICEDPTGRVTDPGKVMERKAEKEPGGITEEKDELEIENIVQTDTVLESPPNLQLSDSLSSTFNTFSVSPSNYNWTYKKESDEMVNIIACGRHPLDVNIEQIEALKVSHYNGIEGAFYACNFEALPDRITVTEYDSSEIGTTQKVQEITTEYEDSSFVNLKPEKVYYITAWWEQDFLESRGFYGQASYQVLTD